jgi:hypothetical protein
MGRKKKYNLANYNKAKKDAKNSEAFKTPAVPAERSGSSVVSSTLSHNSSLVPTDSAVRTRSQARLSHTAGTVALPDFQPIDVEAWTQNSLHASQEVNSLNLPGKPLTKQF